MKVLCGFTLFSCFLLVVSTDIRCPGAAPSRCKCSNILEKVKVECSDEDGITDIPSWLPNNTAILKFDKCDIQNLTGESFKNLVMLTNVDIINQRNRLTLNHSLVFQGLNSLERVFLDGNDIVSLPPRMFANISSLKYVSLNNNPLITLPDDLFENSPNLQTFQVSNTRLDRDIIAKIGAGDFGTNIEQLLISGTPIEHLRDGLFSGLPSLINVPAVGCEIKSIGADILKRTEVKTFTLNKNPIEFINENALRDSKLTAFECSDCKLTSNVTFNGFLKKAAALIRIDLQNNKLTFVPKDAFTNLERLDIIKLSNNSISTIEENPYADLPACDDVTCVQLHDNPLNCDCNLAWLRSFAGEIAGDKTGWKCAQPINVAGKSLISLKLDEFCCVNANATKKCGLLNNPNNAWVVSAHVMVAIISQIVVMFGIPLLFA